MRKAKRSAFKSFFSEHRHGDQTHQQGAQPCHDALVHHHDGCPLAAKLPLDRGHRRDAGGVQQAEHQQRCGLCRGEGCGQGSGRAEEDEQRGHHALLGHKAGDKSGGDAPVRKAQRGKQRGDIACDARQNAGLRVSSQPQLQVKVLQEPDDDGSGKDDRKGLLQESRAFSHSSCATFFRPGRR